MQDREAARSAMRALARPVALAPLTILGGVVVLLIVGGLLAPGFLAISNILLLLSLSAYLGIVAIGETVVILTGGIDLSIAWTITGASIVFTGVTQGDDARLWAGLAAALAVGIGAGFLNGVGVAKLRISPIVMTLGMNNIMQGLTLIYSQGTPSGSAPGSVKWIATGWIGPAPVVVLVWIGLGVIVSIGLHATRGGRYLYGVGESPVVSRLSGVDNDRVIIAAYAISGLCAAVTGVLFTGLFDHGLSRDGRPVRAARDRRRGARRRFDLRRERDLRRRLRRRFLPHGAHHRADDRQHLDRLPQHHLWPRDHRGGAALSSLRPGARISR